VGLTEDVVARRKRIHDDLAGIALEPLDHDALDVHRSRTASPEAE